MGQKKKSFLSVIIKVALNNTLGKSDKRSSSKLIKWKGPYYMSLDLIRLTVLLLVVLHLYRHVSDGFVTL